jgi:hypothetical protein
MFVAALVLAWSLPEAPFKLALAGPEIYLSQILRAPPELGW